MIELFLDTWTMVEKPIPDHYHKYADKIYQHPNRTGMGFTATVVGNRANALGRHPFNIITEEIFG